MTSCSYHFRPNKSKTVTQVIASVKRIRCFEMNWFHYEIEEKRLLAIRRIAEAISERQVKDTHRTVFRGISPLHTLVTVSPSAAFPMQLSRCGPKFRKFDATSRGPICSNWTGTAETRATETAMKMASLVSCIVLGSEESECVDCGFWLESKRTIFYAIY
jgi:hypothetical protein